MHSHTVAALYTAISDTWWSGEQVLNLHTGGRRMVSRGEATTQQAITGAGGKRYKNSSGVAENKINTVVLSD